MEEEEEEEITLLDVLKHFWSLLNLCDWLKLSISSSSLMNRK